MVLCVDTDYQQVGLVHLVPDKDFCKKIYVIRLCISILSNIFETDWTAGKGLY